MGETARTAPLPPSRQVNASLTGPATLNPNMPVPSLVSNATPHRLPSPSSPEAARAPLLTAQALSFSAGAGTGGWSNRGIGNEGMSLVGGSVCVDGRGGCSEGVSLLGGSVCVDGRGGVMRACRSSAAACAFLPLLHGAWTRCRDTLLPSSRTARSYEGYVFVLAPSGASLFVGINDYVQGTLLASQTFAVAASLEWQQVRGGHEGVFPLDPLLCILTCPPPLLSTAD